MSNSVSLLAYPDVKAAFDRAIGSRAGIKVEFETPNQAFRFRGRCNSFRILDRKENAKIYIEPASMLHGRSIYDSLLVTQKGLAVFIVPAVLPEGAVTELE